MVSVLLDGSAESVAEAVRLAVGASVEVTDTDAESMDDVEAVGSADDEAETLAFA